MNDFKLVTRGAKPVDKHLSLDNAHKAQMVDVQQLWKMSVNRGVSPYNQRPLHPDRHQVEQNNPYALLDTDHGGRKMHSVSSRDDLEEVVLELFRSNLWEHAAHLMMHHNTKLPNRLVFHFPPPGGSRTSEVQYTVVTQTGSAAAATVVIDIDESRFLYIMTDFTSVSPPPDQGSTAGGLPCFQIGTDPEMLYVIRDGNLCPEIIGGTTYRKGEFEAFRDKHAPSRYERYE